MDDGSYLQLGVWDEFPPPFDEEEPTYPELQNTWNARVDAVGATVDPGETLDLVVGLAPSTRGDGTARAIRVIYVESNGESYTAETTTEIRIAVGRKSCF